MPPAKKKPTEQQLANLRKGFDALKEKRKKVEAEEEVPIVVPAVEPPPIVVPVVEPPPVVKPKIKREKKERFDPNTFRESLLNELRTPVLAPAERIIEKPVETIVYKERVMTSSEILNKLFNFS
jgi:hypothetical protein